MINELYEIIDLFKKGKIKEVEYEIRLKAILFKYNYDLILCPLSAK